MKKYNIKRPNKDFIFTPEINNKGTRAKKMAVDIKMRKKAIFKYQMYNCSEACSEKISYEIANVLGYDCARVELAFDNLGNLGILNYLFVDINKEEHTDAIAYLKKDSKERKDFHAIENIKKCLDEIDKKLFFQFIKIIVFDALIGEQDRHEENWGITVKDGEYRISPLYDNGCNLLREFYNNQLLEKYDSGQKDFYAYINRSKTLIYKENGEKYKHFELVEYLYKSYPKEIKEEIENLKKLKDHKIESIVEQIPNEIIKSKHKEYIIKYLKERKKILENIIGNGSD